jgi:DNA-binding LacI/PurR family transcriptional regulator
MHIRQLVERSVSGVILAHDPYREMSSAARLLGDSGIPLVCLYGDPADYPCDWVAIDEVEGVQQVIQYLRSLNHSRIAFCRAVAGDRPHPRELAFHQVMQQCKLGLPENFVIPLEQIDSIGGAGRLKDLLGLEAPPTAIFAGNDRVAMIVLKHLASLDVSVPEQVSVIGFDNVRFTEHLPVPLTTVDQPKREMGRRAVDLLLERVELTGTSTSPRREVFHPHLIIRNSCQIAARALVV